MTCIVLKGPNGERRIAQDPDNQFRYTLLPGERFEGGIDPNCGGEIALQPHTDTTALVLAELDKKLGQHAGDWIKVFAGPVARVIGKKDCMSCEVRRVVANAYANLKGKHGRISALRKMFSLWNLARKDPAAAAVKLKEYLS